LPKNELNWKDWTFYMPPADVSKTISARLMQFLSKNEREIKTITS